MATLDWDGLVFYDKQIKKYIENKLVDAGFSKDELDKILDKYASKTYVADEIAKIDLTGYAKTADIDKKLNNYVKKTDAFSGSYNDLKDKPTIPNVSNLAAKADLTAHTSDNSIHITSSERTKWNAKLDNTALNGYATETYVDKKVSDASLSGTVDLSGYAKTSDVDTKLNNYVKKNDAFSGSYNDLTDKPVIPNVTGKADKTYVDTELAKKANKSELFSGSYNDLADKPVIPNLNGYAKTADIDTKLNNYVKKNEAFSGSYNDLKDKPVIPDTSNLATKVELNNHVGSTKHITDDERTKWNGYNDTINTMKTNFEDGVNTIYNAVVAKGVTPLDKSPSSIVDAIEKLVLMISNPLLIYTFETGSPIMPLLNGVSTYNNYFIDTDNGDGTTTRKLYVVGRKVNKISFAKKSDTSSLISLDNTTSIKLTSTNNMFNGCDKLRFANLSNLDTSNVKDMSGMFYNCKSLTSLYMSNFDTSNVTSMSGMFYSCNSLTSLDVSDFDTSKVTTMRYMFSDCNSLASLDIRSFSSESLEDSSGMIYYVPSNCKVYVDKTKFTKTEADCNFTGTFIDVSQQG